MYTLSKSANNKTGINIESRMMMPPMVGVPFFCCSPANPKSRTDSPIWLRFNKLISRLPYSVAMSKDKITDSTALKVMN